MLDEYRLIAEAEIQALIKQLFESETFVTLSAPKGVSYITLMWDLDPQLGYIGFSVDPHDAQVTALLNSGEATATGYLESIKIQFDLAGLMLVRGAERSVLQAQYPKELFRFQRRSCFRVRPLQENGPVARLKHPGQPNLALELRVIDISLSGVALFLPSDITPIDIGSKIARCQIHLNDDIELDVSLEVHHINLPTDKGVRLGCEMKGLDGSTIRALQRYLDMTQKRRYALELQHD